MVESSGQKSLPECYISDGPRYYGPMYSTPTNAVQRCLDPKDPADKGNKIETARGHDCSVRFRDIFGVEHMIDFSDKNKTHRDSITIWVPIEPNENQKRFDGVPFHSEMIWYDNCGKTR